MPSLWISSSPTRKDITRKGVTQAYVDIRSTLASHGFDWVKGSLYVNQTEDLAKLFAAIMALKTLARLPSCVRDSRAFHVEQWSDFRAVVKA